MRKMQKLLWMLLVFSSLLSQVALAAPDVAITIAAEKEVTIEEQGKKIVKRVPAEKTVPDEVLFYTIRYKNETKTPATDVVINDPIPSGTTYILGSAYGTGTIIEFSVDGGESYKQPSTLTYEVRQADGKIIKRRAIPEDYTHIRWIIGTIPPGKGDKLGFQVKVK